MTTAANHLKNVDGKVLLFTLLLEMSQKSVNLVEIRLAEVLKLEPSPRGEEKYSGAINLK